MVLRNCVFHILGIDKSDMFIRSSERFLLHHLYILPSSFSTVMAQGIAGMNRWPLNKKRKNRTVVRIQRVTATNITQPYTGSSM